MTSVGRVIVNAAIFGVLTYNLVRAVFYGDHFAQVFINTAVAVVLAVSATAGIFRKPKVTA